MPVSRLDAIYRKILLTKFFVKGWGTPENIQRLFEFRKIISDREKCYKLVPKYYPITIMNEQVYSDHRIIDGKFQSPFSVLLKNLVPKEVEDCYFQMVLPMQWKEDNYKPICIHLAGTGDHYFWRRRNIMAKPLLKKGIGAIILENPFYGLRKPKDQLRSSLHYVSDIFVMGGCLIFECLILLNYCEQLGFGPLGVTGISMGGHMASLAASNWPKPLVLVPCLSWSTASSVFTEGVMSDSIDWDLLQQQYTSNKLYCETLSKLCKIVDDPFACTLSQYPDFTFDAELLEEKISYVTPFDMLNMMRNGALSGSNNIVSYSKLDNLENCPEMTYKSSLTKQKTLAEIESLTLASKKIIEMKKRNKEALWFMRGIMDECTHLKNFSVPVDTSLIISVCAESDGYVPRRGVSSLEEVWPGATVKYVGSGHVGAYIWYRKLFRDSIVEAFNRAKQKLPPPKREKIEI